MENLNTYVAIYKEQLQKGAILVAYRELVKFVMKLRTEFIQRHSDTYSFSGILHGYMDYTYFYYSNDFLKTKKLKLGLVLNHLEMRFEVWLLGTTKPIQKKYWELSKNTKWNNGNTKMPEYSILEITLVEDPNFNDLDTLAEKIEVEFIKSSDELLDYLKMLED